MLEQTFCHVPGIGQQAERKLWDAGIRSWDAALRTDILPVHAGHSQTLRRHVAEARQHLDRRNAGFFAQTLPPREHWRIFPHFAQNVAYLDIETTGTMPGSDYITTICLYDGREVRYYVHGANLDDFRDDIRRYDLLVSYNGKSFDIPFIQRYFGIAVEAAHIDLRHILASLGYRGGLKGCEKQFGIARNDLDGVDGFFAVLLWYDFFNRGNRRALETLLAYNMMDVVNLEHLMIAAYNLKIAATPFAAQLALAIPRPPPIPFAPDMPTINRLRARYPG